MLGAILKQLAYRNGIQELIREVFRKAKKEVGGRGLRLPDMVYLLRNAVSSLPRLFICIDALDEIIPHHLLNLLTSLQDIVAVSPNIRVFLTGRPQIVEEITRYFSQVVLVTLSPSTEDIKNYLEMKLDRDPEPMAMPDGLRADIMRIIPEKISDM